MNYFIRRLISVVTDSDKKEANEICAEITNNPEDRNTYSIPLFTKDILEPTHWTCSTVASDEMVDKMQAEMHRVPSIQFFLLDAAEERLLNTNVSAASNKIGETINFGEVLALVNLKRVEVKMN